MRGIRLLVLSVIWLGSFFLAFDRVNISLAAPGIMSELGFDGMQMGFVLSIYYWGYLFGNFSGGIISDQLRLRALSTGMILMWCVLTALTGACHTLWQFGVVRLLFGLFEGATANLMHKLQNNWLLPAERGRGYGIFIGFVYLGVAFGMPLVGWLIKLWDWRAMFYASALMTLVLAALFSFIIRDDPREHPWMPEREKEQIREALAKDRVTFDAHAETAGVSAFWPRVIALTRIPPFWFMCVASFFGVGVYFTNMSWLPGYLVKERGYTVMNSGVYLTIPYLAAFAGMWSAGGLGDRFGNRSLVGLATGVLTFPALLGLAWSQEVNTTILMMSIVLFLNSASLNGIIVLLFDIIPAEVFGTSVGIVGGLCGGLSGVIGPLMLGYLYDRTGSFFWGFVALGLGATLGALALLPVISYEKRIKHEKAVKRALTPAAPVIMGEEVGASQR
jgi:MFS transporter, ACS family, D-galactonate transporter